MLCDPLGKGLEDHWQKTSFALLAGLILHTLYRHRARGETASLADVAYALSDPTRPADELWREMVDNRHLGDWAANGGRRRRPRHDRPRRRASEAAC